MNDELDKKIDKIIETLLVRPLNTPGAYAETEKLKQGIKKLIQAHTDKAVKEARIDELENLQGEEIQLLNNKTIADRIKELQEGE